MGGWTDVDKADNFAPGDARLVDVDDTMIAVFNIAGEYFALEDVCTHDGSAILGSGVDLTELIADDELTCPHHGAKFCIRNGEALAPPAYEPITSFPVRVENGMVQVRDPRMA
ncbi:MAG: non-heme iron oxygenase ferredoxin subunit [Gammaproteobacteria bacterium]